MKGNNLVSVILSVYNGEETIGKAINSILNQTYKELEILIVDDNSTDNTHEILLDYEKKNENIRIFKNPTNIGLTKSLNVIIPKSKGGILFRQDADDISLESRLQEQLELIYIKNLDFCTTRAKIKGTSQKIPGISHYLSKKILIKNKNPFIHGTLAIKKNVIEEIGLYDENFYYAQDYKLFKDLLLKGYKYKVINKELYELNMHNNISKNKISEQNYYAHCIKNNIKPETIK
jgi:glycosyltransferase involved in cell wall biosynthesis|tara:strand:+ start:1741 stop:2439 length:699 start_codon:yes stop_codon:yes gene_type:complete